MRVYLASPSNQHQAEPLRDMPVLLSFACWRPLLERYQQSFDRILIDSGAFSELNSGKKVDLEKYKDWSLRWDGHADAVAGLDDISGDWRRSLRNYEAQPWAFPTYHEADPPELLDELVAMARERTGWIGLGMTPPRMGREAWVRDACARIPEDLHVHGWALREYTHVRRLDSVDSTDWWRQAMKTHSQMPWLTYGECLEIEVKRYKRWRRVIVEEHPSLFAVDCTRQ